MVKIFWFFHLFFFRLWMYPFDLIVSSAVEMDRMAFSQLWNVLLLLSDLVYMSC